jgi:tetratricopeptide (TPR) repeat protein
MRKGSNLESGDSVEVGKSHYDIYIQLLAQSGQLDQALKVAEAAKIYLEKSGRPLFDYWYGMGSIFYIRGEMDSSIYYLKKDVAGDKGYRCFAPRYWLGRAYLEVGKLPEAIDEFERQRDRIDCLYLNHSIWKAEIHYYLGIAYEKSNWTEKAIQEYRRFLEIFKNADLKILSHYDATSRLARLEHKL